MIKESSDELRADRSIHPGDLDLDLCLFCLRPPIPARACAVIGDDRRFLASLPPLPRVFLLPRDSSAQDRGPRPTRPTSGKREREFLPFDRSPVKPCFTIYHSPLTIPPLLETPTFMVVITTTTTRTSHELTMGRGRGRGIKTRRSPVDKSMSIPSVRVVLSYRLAPEPPEEPNLETLFQQ